MTIIRKDDILVMIMVMVLVVFVTTTTTTTTRTFVHGFGMVVGSSSHCISNSHCSSSSSSNNKNKNSRRVGDEHDSVRMCIRFISPYVKNKISTNPTKTSSRRTSTTTRLNMNFNHDHDDDTDDTNDNHDNVVDNGHDESRTMAAMKFKIVTCSATSCAQAREQLGMDPYATFSAMYTRSRNSNSMIGTNMDKDDDDDDEDLDETFVTSSSLSSHQEYGGVEMTVEESSCLGGCSMAPCVGVEHEDYIGTVALEGMTESEFTTRLFHRVVTEDDADRIWSCIEQAIYVMAEHENDDDDDDDDDDEKEDDDFVGNDNLDLDIIDRSI